MTNTSSSFLNKKLRSSNQTAVICGDQNISYSQLFHAVSACTEHLRTIGITSGNRVALLSPNSVDYIIALLSLWSIEAIACPLNIRHPEEALESQLQQVNAQYLLTSQTAIINSTTITAHKFDLSQMTNVEVTGHHSISESFLYKEDQSATILFTSGSSNRPKAVLHSLGNHISNARGSNELMTIVEGDQWLLSLPLYHVGGLSILFRILLSGATIVIPQPNENISQVIRTSDLTHISLVATQLIRLLNDKGTCLKLQNLKVILVGGGAIPQSLLIQSAEMNLPIYITYGSTELASQIATAKYPLPVNTLHNREIKISEEGEILAKGKTLFSGYVDKDRIALPLTENGWFKTGDLGSIDSKGGLVVTGRKDNMFISGGENIHPEEIEKSLYQVDAIEKTIVVPIQNDEFGYRPIAFIKTYRNTPIKEEELYNHLGSQLPKFKVPEKFYAWPTDLSAENSKINRRYLMKQVRDKNISLKQIN